MTQDAVRTIAQADPVPTLTARWGEATKLARERVTAVADSCRELARLEEQLGEHDIKMVAGLGPIGDAARAAFVTTEEHKARHDHDFQMPKAS